MPCVAFFPQGLAHSGEEGTYDDKVGIFFSFWPKT